MSTGQVHYLRGPFTKQAIRPCNRLTVDHKSMRTPAPHKSLYMEKAMSPDRKRTIKTRRPRELDLALATTLFWGSMLLFYLVAPNRQGLTALAVLTPIAFLAWAWAIAAVRARNASGKTLEQLRALSPDEFEEWAGARFRDLGYAVRVTGRGGDHGVDLLAEKPGEVAVIQCKRFRQYTVGEPLLRDLYGAMHDFGANRAYLVTTGRLTQAAAEWVRGKPIEVWDGERVAKLSMQQDKRQVKAAAVPTAARSSATMESTVPAGPEPPAAPEATQPATAALCPRCGAPLVHRRNRSTGEHFLGCSRFPQCRYTQPITTAGAHGNS